MIEVGVRELKSRLSYYLQLMQAGETIAIKMRRHVIGFLSNFKSKKPSLKKTWSPKELQRKMMALKEEGFLLNCGHARFRPFKRVKLSPGPSSTEIIRQMRDED